MAVIGSLSVKLGLVTVEWDKATAQAKKQAKDLQGSFNNLGLDLKNLGNTFNAVGGAMGLSLAGLGVLSKATMDMAGQVDDLSKSYDLSIARVLQFQQALILSGGKAEDASRILSTMFGKIAAAQEGNEAAISTFESLGITFAELQTTHPDEIIRKVYEGLAGIGNTYERIKAVREIIGKNGLGRDIAGVAEALGKSTAGFKQQEESMRRLAQFGDVLDNTYTNIKLALADMLSPFAGGGGKALVNVETFKAAMVGITAVAVISGMFKLVAAFKALNVALRTTASLGLAISAAGGIKGVAMAGAGLATFFAAKAAFESESEDAEAAANAESTKESDGQPAPKGDPSARKEIVAGQARVQLAKQLLDIERRRSEFKLAAVRGDKFSLELAEVQLKYEEEIAKAANEKAQAYSKAGITLGANGQITAEFQKNSAQLAIIEAEYQQKVAAASQKEKSERALINAQRERELQLMMQQAQFAMEMESINKRREELDGNRYKMTEFEFRIAQERLNLERKLLELDQRKREALDKVGGDKFNPEYVAQSQAIEGMIEAERKLAEVRIGNVEAERTRQQSFSEGWNLAFRQFSEDAENYARVGGESFNAVVSNMNSAIDSFVRTGKFSFKDFAKSIIQDLIAIQLKMQAMQLFKMGMSFFGGGMGGGMTLGGAADGGFINAPTIVGEHGAELFIPNRQGGTVIPNQQLSGMGAGQPQVVYNGTVIQNMQAIDTQSAAQFIARNKDAVYAANLSASRSLPASR
jgi:lambda family phage tail tape measure protein